MDRNIFPYIDDSNRQLYADPVRILRALTCHSGGSIHALMALARSDNPEQAFHATDRVIAAVRASFGLAPFDPQTGTGPTEDECLDLLDSFFAFLEEKKKPLVNGPTSPAPTVPASSHPTATTTSPSGSC